VIGGGDWADHRIVPDCIRALQKGNHILVRNPASTRPWQHVLEALSGYLALGARLLQGDARATGAWNFGPRRGNARTVQDLVETVIGAWGKGAWMTQVEPDAPHEAHALLLDCGKAATRLQWSPRWDFEETVARTVNWYRDVCSGGAAAKACIEDISRYMAMDGGGHRGKR
jgi:CDP-glucose 4,6-dehydratase